MGDPTLLYCVGATKAGTSWLHNTLKSHPECHLRAVKELHYWNTFDADAQAAQVAHLQSRIVVFRKQSQEAKAQGRDWQVRNLARRITDAKDLIKVLTGDRTWDANYANWMLGGIEQHKLVADLTPGYCLLDEDTFRRMAAFKPSARFLFLIRDPLSRLWSHVRMQASRRMTEGDDYSEKANNILWRALNTTEEKPLLDRGDYKATISRLRRSVPSGQLMVAYSESMFSAEGMARICDFAGISVPAFEQDTLVHEGVKTDMREKLVPQAVQFLREQYDWVAEHVGPLPASWQASMVKG